MLVTHTLPQIPQRLTQGQLDIAFGMPLKREVPKQFKSYSKAFDCHPLFPLITFFSKAPVYEETQGEMIENLPFPALYGMVGEEGFAISTLLMNHILQEALGLSHLEQTNDNFSQFELALITKSLQQKCQGLQLSSEVSMLEGLMNEQAVKSIKIYANRSQVILTLFEKTEAPLKRDKVIFAHKMITPECLEGLRLGDALIFENTNPKEVHLEGENSPFSLIQNGSQFYIKSKEA